MHQRLQFVLHVRTMLGGDAVSMSDHAEVSELEGELHAVAQAAGARLRAETDEDAEAARAAADELMQAASTAMGAGHSLTEITRAEALGKETVRQTLRADALRHVERTGKRAREMQAEHYRAIARATRLGLTMRDIAHAAGVTHGTIRAINHRLAEEEAPAETEATDEGGEMSAWEEPAHE